MTRKSWAFLAMLLALAPAGRCEPHVSDWRAYQTNDGIADNNCLSVAIGPRGKVWAGHSPTGPVSGLDGYGITNIPVQSAFHGRVYQSAGGQLWLACADGLEEWIDGKWIHYTIPEIATFARPSRTNRGAIVPLCPVRLGHVLFLLPDALMQLDIEDANTYRSTPLLPAFRTGLDQFLGMTASARDGSLWIAGRRGLTHAGPARALRPDSEWHEYLPPDGWHIQDLREPMEDSDGGITAVAESQTNGQKVIVHFDGQQWEEHPVEGENIRLAWRGPDGIYWAATSDAVFQLDRNNQLVPNEVENARQFFDVAVEPGGNFWLATSDGLFRYSPPTWQTPAAIRNLSAPVTALSSDENDRLWAASPAALYSLRGERWTVYAIPEDISRDFSTARQIFAITNGVMVLAAGNRLVQFDESTGRFNPLSASQNSRLRAVGMMGDGTLCVQETEAGPGDKSPKLETFDGVSFKAFPLAPAPDKLGNDLLLLAPAGSGPWLAGSKGIARYRDQKWQMFGPQDQPVPEGISCIAEMNDGRIWCGCQDKIWECDGKNWRLVLGGLEKVNGILVERDGTVWVASNSGVQHFQRGQWVANDIEEGLSSGVVFSICEDNSGRIWTGTAHGLGLYHPEADPDPPQTSVIYPSPTLREFPEGSPLDMTFSAQDKWKFTAAGRLLFSYRLDEGDWSVYGERRSVSLPELPAGKHYFQVRSMDRNWNQDPGPALVEFAIVPPWYKESRLLLIISGGSVIVLFFAWVAVNRHLQLRRSHAEIEAQVALRTKQLELANQELLHSQKMNALGTLAAGIAHDFNSILSIIKGSAQIIEDNLGNEEKIRVRTSRIKTVVEQGAGIVKAMLGFSRATGGERVMCDVNALVGETIKLLGDRFLREVEVRFEPVPSLPEVPASRDFIQQILLNLIFNAAEAMTDHRQIDISAVRATSLPPALVLAPPRAGDYVFVSVRDSGCGIPPEIMPRIFEPFFTTKSLSTRRGTGLGLSMVYELARQMEAGLAVESTLGRGSVFTLILPVRDLPVDSGGRRD
jgi:signal transduction histidine kinase